MTPTDAALQALRDRVEALEHTIDELIFGRAERLPLDWMDWLFVTVTVGLFAVVTLAVVGAFLGWL